MAVLDITTLDIGVYEIWCDEHDAGADYLGRGVCLYDDIVTYISTAGSVVDVRVDDEGRARHSERSGMVLMTRLLDRADPDPQIRWLTAEARSHAQAMRDGRKESA